MSVHPIFPILPTSSKLFTQRITRNRSRMFFPERFFLLLMFHNPFRYSVELQALLARDGATVHVVFPWTDLQQRSL